MARAEHKWLKQKCTNAGSYNQNLNEHEAREEKKINKLCRSELFPGAAVSLTKKNAEWHWHTHYKIYYAAETVSKKTANLVIIQSQRDNSEKPKMFKAAFHHRCSRSFICCTIISCKNSFQPNEKWIMSDKQSEPVLCHQMHCSRLINTNDLTEVCQNLYIKR